MVEKTDKSILILGNYNDNAMYHPFNEVSKSLTSILSSENVTCSENINDLCFCERYSLIISYWDDWKNPIPEDAAKALTDFVNKGGAFIGIHNGISFHLRDNLKELIGAGFITHPTQEEITFKMKIHPLTKGVSDFSVMEEPYQFSMVDDDKDIFMTYIYRNKEYPAGWCKNYGSGKVIYLTPGHTMDKFSIPEYVKLIKNCTEWCI